MKKLILLGLVIGTSTFAQVSDNLITILSCSSGRGDADTYYTLEIDKHSTDGSLFLSTFKISDGEKNLEDFIQVFKSTGPTKVETYVSAANSIQLRLKQKRHLSAKLTDSRNSKKIETTNFEECTRN